MRATNSTTGRIIGPSGSRQRQRSLMLLSLAGVLALAFAVNSYGGPVGTAAGFEDDDGNLTPQAPINFDWNSFARATWSPHPATTPTRQTDAKTVNGFQFKGIEDWQDTGSDSAFAGGTKQDDNCPSVTSAKAPNKDDLKRIYLASKTAANGHTYLELAWARIPQNTTSASAHVGFEFNQSSTLCGAGSDGLVQRTAGDMLIVYDFEGGSASPVITLRRWVTSGACEVGSSSPPCWGPAVNLTASGFAEAKVNVGTTVLDQLAPPALSSTLGTSVNENLNDSEFGEAGIDLTAAGVIPVNSCASFGKAYAVSRSSGNSAQAQMKDLVGPANFSLNNCGEIKIIKRTNPRGLNQNFSFTSNIAGAQLTCTADTTPSSFTLNDNGNTSSDSSANTERCTNVPAGSYTVTEGADPTGFAFQSLSCTATGAGSSGSQDATNPKQANITLAGGGVVTCVYVNRQLLGAIKVSKVGKDKSQGSGNQPLAGAKFSITSNGTPISGSPFTTGSGGTVCVGNLPFGNYSVQETQAPPGYSRDDTTAHTVAVNNSANCADNPYGGESIQFTDTPLTDIDVDAAAQAPGATESQINCVNSSGGNVGNSGSGFTDPAHADANNLPPGTYTCTVVVDP
jgi:Prealbumin-like fold domain